MSKFGPHSRSHTLWRMVSAAAFCMLALVGIKPVRLCGQAARATVSLAGLQAPVHVYRDTLGIPHIYASSSQDAYLVLGYLHATDRLFEMEMFRRRASGTLAEVFGKASLDDDIFVRQIGIRRSAEAAWKSHRLDGRIRSEIKPTAPESTRDLCSFKSLARLSPRSFSNSASPRRPGLPWTRWCSPSTWPGTSPAPTPTCGWVCWLRSWASKR